RVGDLLSTRDGGAVRLNLGTLKAGDRVRDLSLSSSPLVTEGHRTLGGLFLPLPQGLNGVANTREASHQGADGLSGEGNGVRDGSQCGRGGGSSVPDRAKARQDQASPANDPGSTVGVEVDLHPASIETIRRSIDRPQLGHGLSDVGVRLDVDVFAAGRQRIDLCLGLGDLGVDVDLGLAALALELTDPRLGLGNVRINFNVDLGPPSLHGTELGLEFLILEVGLDVDLGPPSLHAAELGLEFLVLEVGLDVDLAVPRDPVQLALDTGVAQPR